MLYMGAISICNRIIIPMECRQGQECPQVEIIEQKNNKISNTVIRKYAKKKFLGKGGFAKCYEVENLQTKQVQAIKIISKQTLKKSKAKQKLVTQIKIHRSLQHKHILLFDHVFEDSENVYIILEICPNHTLNEMIKKRKRITETELQYYLHQLIQGLIYTHHHKVIHRDLKLGNIMLNQNMEVKIGDFGLAARVQFPGEKRKTICGTPNYLAPEIVNNVGHSYQVDIWSLGVIMYTLLFGRPPFETSDVKKTYKRIKECQYTFNQDLSISNSAKNLISKVLVLDPSKRLTLEQILAHPFMTHSKIPRQLQSSVLHQAPQRSFLDQHGGTTPHFSSSKYFPGKSDLKPDGDLQRVKSQKNISQRLLLRTATGLNRNIFYNKQYPNKQDQYQLKSNPQLLNNNYFKPDSSKSNSRNVLHGCHGVYVKKWVDYSSKYGLGYLLSNGMTGIYFNDATKMILDENGQKVDYVTNQNLEGKKLVTFSTTSCPDDKELSKKVTLMQYFRKYLQTGSGETAPVKTENVPFVYIKKWVKSDQAIMFRLNNKLIQTNFNDKSQVMLYTQKDILLYSSGHSKDKQIVDLNSPDLNKNSEISRRMQHVKVLLRKLTSPSPAQTLHQQQLTVQPLRS